MRPTIDLTDVARVSSLEMTKPMSHMIEAGRGLVLINGAVDRSPRPSVAAASVGSARHQQLIIDGSGHYVPIEQGAALAHALLGSGGVLGGLGGLVGLSCCPDGLCPGAVAEQEGALVGDEADDAVG